MIITELYDGQGLGNQLWCYVVTRLIAEKNGYEFGIMSTNKFKGKEFMFLDFGKPVIGGSGPEGGPPITLPEGINEYYKENLVRHHTSGLDISPKDYKLLTIPDNTKIDGTMQSFEYVKNDKAKIIDYLKINLNYKTLDYSDDNVCIIHIRGGDFRNSSAMLSSIYYTNAINYFKEKNENIIFYIVTDDITTARQILPNIEIIGSAITNLNDSNKANHHLGGPIWMDYLILNNAKNIIISASSFSWWPVWTNTNNPMVIAPKYWAAHKTNSGYWSCGESLVEGWHYMDINGVISDYNTCKKELE
jgi:hypothetical protein